VVLGAVLFFLAVHSGIFCPCVLGGGWARGGGAPPAAVEDVIVSRTSATGAGAIATGSVRRQYQLHWKFPGVEITDLRGNVPTRLRKLVQSNWRGIVLARAGLERLGYEIESGSFVFEESTLRAQSLSSDDFLSAGGQGIVALQIRSDDLETAKLIEPANHRETLSCLQAEREFLRLLEGDCGSPVGVLATIAGGTMTMRAQVFEPPRVEPRTARVDGDAGAPTELARELWEATNG
jgi:hydroxymethylbilane synthase